MAGLFCPNCKNGFRTYAEAHAQGWTGSAFSDGDRCPECDTGILKRTRAALEVLLVAAMTLNANQAQQIKELRAVRDCGKDGQGGLNGCAWVPGPCLKHAQKYIPRFTQTVEEVSDAA
jgi:hypothetical protein